MFLVQRKENFYCSAYAPRKRNAPKLKAQTSTVVTRAGGSETRKLEELKVTPLTEPWSAHDGVVIAFHGTLWQLHRSPIAVPIAFPMDGQFS